MKAVLIGSAIAGIVIVGSKVAIPKVTLKRMTSPYTVASCAQQLDINATNAMTKSGKFNYFENPPGACCAIYTKPMSPFQFNSWQDHEVHGDTDPRNIALHPVEWKLGYKAMCVDQNQGKILGPPTAGLSCCGVVDQ